MLDTHRHYHYILLLLRGKPGGALEARERNHAAWTSRTEVESDHLPGDVDAVAQYGEHHQRDKEQNYHPNRVKEVFGVLQKWESTVAEVGDEEVRRESDNPNEVRTNGCSQGVGEQQRKQ